MPRSTRSTDEPKETLGRLSFNTTAARQLFPESESAKGVRLRLPERGGGVILHPTKSTRGVDVIAIERRPREVAADIEPGTLSRQVMRRLYKAGLTEQQPYFLVEPAARGWFGLEHVPDQEPPKKQPVVTVSGFDPPPVKADMTHWRRFLKAITSDKLVDAEEWETTRLMILTAERITSRRGRHSQQRELASRLLEAVERNAVELLTWAKRQPEYGEDVIALLDELEMQPEAMPSPQPADEADDAAAAEVLAFAERLAGEQGDEDEQAEGQQGDEDEQAEGDAVAAAEADEGEVGGEDDTPSTAQETSPEARIDEGEPEPEQPEEEESSASHLERGEPEAVESDELFESELDPEEPEEPVERSKEGVEHESDEQVSEGESEPDKTKESRQTC